MIRTQLHRLRHVLGPKALTSLILTTSASVFVALLDVVALSLIALILVPDGVGPLAIGNLPLLGSASPVFLGSVTAGLLVAKTLLMALIRWWIAGVVSRLRQESTSRLFRAYMRADSRFHDTTNSSQIVKTNAVTSAQFFDDSMMAVGVILSEFATVIVLLTFAMTLSPLPSLVTASLLITASAGFIRSVQGRAARLTFERNAIYEKSLRFIKESSDGWRESHTRRILFHQISDFKTIQAELAQNLRLNSFLSDAGRYFLEIILLVGVGSMGILLAITSDGPESEATFIISVGVGVRALPSLARVLSSLVSVRRGIVALELISAELLCAESAVSDSTSQTPKPSVPLDGLANEVGDSKSEPRSVVQFEQVELRYPGRDELVLDGVDFKILHGEFVGLIGRSGSGKSSLVSLILGTRAQTSGVVLVDGRQPPSPADVVDHPSIHCSAIGLVPQNVFIWDLSLEDNIALGLPVIKDLMDRVLMQADLSDFVSSLPGGLQTLAGENGSMLSGGQRQRLGIARALYVQPELLLLDEATAGLDRATESAIMESILRLKGQISVLCISHHSRTLSGFDRVLRLENGKIEELYSEL